jgi:hypothetical protein
MSIACVINTSCLAKGADTLLSSGRVPYGRRAWLMRNVILPTYRWSGIFSEIVVVGEFEPGDGYTYIPAESIYRNCADALWKRQVGFDKIQNKVQWVLFQHDDHLYDPLNVYPNTRTTASVLSPSRWTRARSADGEPLNDGHAMGHINGHACLMRSSIFPLFNWAKIPPVFTWDIETTAVLDDLAIPMAYAPELKVWDLEEGATPWR